jgi:molecular chaperone DnaK
VVDVRIYQGENEDALENIKIGQFMVEGLREAKAGNPVVLDLALDRDGILHVTAREKNTGLERRISIDQAVARYGAEELRRARDRIGTLFGQNDMDPTLGADVVGAGRTAAAALLAKASAQLDTIGEEDRLEMIDLMETIRDAEAAGDTTTLEQAQTQLGDLLFYLDT